MDNSWCGVSGVGKPLAEYDATLCEQAAWAAYEVIKLADEGVYSLVPWADYHTMFCDTRATVLCRYAR